MPKTVDLIFPKSVGFRFLKIAEAKLPFTPTKKVVAKCTIEAFLWISPEKLWEQTSQFSGISKEFHDAYFEGKQYAAALKLKDIKFFKKPKDLKAYNVIKAPQSYQYMEIPDETEQ